MAMRVAYFDRFGGAIHREFNFIPSPDVFYLISREYSYLPSQPIPAQAGLTMICADIRLEFEVCGNAGCLF